MLLINGIYIYQHYSSYRDFVLLLLGRVMSSRKIVAVQGLTLRDDLLNPTVKLLPQLDRNDVTLIHDQVHCTKRVAPAQTLKHDWCMWVGDHSILSTVDDHNPLAPHTITNLLQLSGRLTMPAGGYGLRHEAMSNKAGRVSALAQLAGSHSITITGERLDDAFRFALVWFVKPFFGVQVVLDVGELDVDRARYARNQIVVSRE